MEFTDFDQDAAANAEEPVQQPETVSAGEPMPELLRQEQEAEQRHQALRQIVARERDDRLPEIARRSREREEYLAEETAAREAFKAATKRRNKRRLSIVLPLLALAVLLAALTPTVLLPLAKHEIAYHQAKTMLKNGQYDDARDVFNSLEGYRDSEDMAREAVYQKASRFLDAEEYDAAWELFASIPDYSDASQKAQECRYRKALWLEGMGEFEQAIDIWSEIPGYADSADCIVRAEAEWKEADYQTATGLMDAGKYSEAADIFQKLGDYKDSAQQYQNSVYHYACDLLNKMDYRKASEQFLRIDGYSDSHDKYLESCYKLGSELLEKEQFEEAIKAFEKCGSYSDAANMILKAKYGYVAAHVDDPDSVAKVYIKALQDAHYPGAEALYKQMYRWRAEVYAINDSQYSTVNKGSVSKYQAIYFHFRILGGEPGGQTNVRVVISTAGGGTHSGSLTGCTAGSDWVYWFYYYNPAYAPSGNITITLYDAAGNVIGTGCGYYG